MSDELRAAAETVVQRWESRPPGACPSEAVIAAIQLARAYLAEHPADDGEPTSREWVASISTTPGLYFAFSDGCGIYFVFNDAGGYMAISDGVNQQAELAIPATRGHVRRLLAALGVTP